VTEKTVNICDSCKKRIAEGKCPLCEEDQCRDCQSRLSVLAKTLENDYDVELPLVCHNCVVKFDKLMKMVRTDGISKEFRIKLRTAFLKEVRELLTNDVEIREVERTQTGNVIEEAIAIAREREKGGCDKCD
jgi:hypothetical protein